MRSKIKAAPSQKPLSNRQPLCLSSELLQQIYFQFKRSVLHMMRLPQRLRCLQDQRATFSALISLLLGLGLGLLLRHSLGGGEQWREEDLVWLSLPGNLFVRTLSCLAMPLVLPKLITAIGSMDLKIGGKCLGRVLLFYGALNIIIETSGVLIFHAVIPNDKEILGKSTNTTESDYETVSQLPFSFAIKDLVFNLAPDNVFTAPFRRFRTKVQEVDGKLVFLEDFSLDPNILGLVIVSSAFGVAIAW